MNIRAGAAATLFAGAMLAAGAVAAQTTWNMPVRSNTQNYMTQNAMQFAEDVAENTGGEIEVELHPEDALVRQPDVMRAVQTGQVELGEYLMSMQSNLSPIFAVDAIPFLAVGYEANRKLAEAARPAIEEELASRGLKLLFIQSVAAAGHLRRQGGQGDRRLRGHHHARLQPLHGAAGRADGRDARDGAAGRGAAGVLDRRGRGDDHLAHHRRSTLQAWDFVSHFYDVAGVHHLEHRGDEPADLRRAVARAAAGGDRAAAERAEERGWENAPHGDRGADPRRWPTTASPWPSPRTRCWPGCSRSARRCSTSGSRPRARPGSRSSTATARQE